MSSAAPLKFHNKLLDVLPRDVCARLRPHLNLLELPAGKILYEAGVAQTQMFFPRSGVVSLLFSLESGDTSEIGLIGNEGLIGTALMVDSQSTPTRAVVQAAGQALTLKSEEVDREFNRGGEFQYLVLRYNQVLLGQMAQTAVCNRYHTVERQLSRWLLMCVEKLQSEALEITQEAIASRLGVRREAVTEAAGRLQQAGIVSYSRGRIRVLDRQGIEERSCECYGTVKREYDRLMTALPWLTPPP
jgi:CRP-like cAMP-binding protein